jgi:riboflavin-specific deaminase-like protein
MMEHFTRLYPDRADGLTALDVVADLPRPAPDGRPWIALNMVSTADGRVTVAGRTQAITNRADYELFHATRERVDAIMVGAETIRVESYGRTINNADARERRARAGLPPDSIAVVVSRSVSLPADVGLLRAADNTVVVLTPSPEAELPAAAATVHYLRESDPAVGLRRVREEFGVRSLVCEGGPHLNGTLLPAGLVDELHLVYAPKLAGGADPLTILSGPAIEPPIDLELRTLHESDGYLFARYALGG